MAVDDTISKVESKEEEQADKDIGEVYSAADHYDKFNPSAYLESFYKSATEDTAMQIVLFFLPGIICRLPSNIRTVLDLGAGPTIYLPISLRQRAQKIYTSDYALANREALRSWVEKRSSFDWNAVCRWIASIEATEKSSEKMEQDARDKVQAILEVNVHEVPVVKSICWKANDKVEIPEKFQVVATVFCLEYSCETLHDYNRAVRNACSLIEDEGYLVQGGVLDATTYNFGGKIFKCHQLKKSHIIESLKANGFCVDNKECFKFIEHDDIFILCARKTVNPAAI